MVPRKQRFLFSIQMSRIVSRQILINDGSLHMAGRLLGHRRADYHQPLRSSRRLYFERGCRAGGGSDSIQKWSPMRYPARFTIAETWRIAQE